MDNLPLEQQEFNDWYSDLPAVLKAILEEPEEINQYVLKRATEHGFTTEQADKLEYYLKMVLLLLIPVTDFEDYLKKDLGLSSEKTKEVAKQIDVDFFRLVESELHEFAETYTAIMEPDENDNVTQVESDYITKDDLLGSLKSRKQQIQETAKIFERGQNTKPATAPEPAPVPPLTQTQSPFVPRGERKDVFEAPEKPQLGYQNTKSTEGAQPVPRYKKPLTDIPGYNREG